ncbi:MAG: trypsin-like serine protease [Pseudomonadota bacterium]
MAGLTWKAAALLLWAGHATAQALPESNRETQVYRPQYDAICAAGQSLSAGCDTIRAREIVDAAQAPWRAVGRVNFASGRTRHHCTGTLVAEQVVLTAAHCVFNFTETRWIVPKDLTFVAGFQRGDFVGAAQVERYVLDPLVDLSVRSFSVPPARDWALLVLTEPLGRLAGRVPVALDSSVTGPVLAGYAGLRPQVVSVANDCGPARAAIGLPFIQVRCAAMRGDSGGPLLERREAGWRVVGVFSSLLQRTDGVVGAAVPVQRFREALEDLIGAPL